MPSQNDLVDLELVVGFVLLQADELVFEFELAVFVFCFCFFFPRQLRLLRHG